MEMNDEGQLHTLEGLAAAILITTTLLMIINLSVIANPQSEMQIDVQMERNAVDVLAVLDIPTPGVLSQNLTEYVAAYNSSIPVNMSHSALPQLETYLSNSLTNTIYNVDIAYVNNESLIVAPVIIKGAPGENSIVTRRIVVLDNSTVVAAGGTWNLSENEIKVVEVRLTTWKV
ncbi:hypothetical protein J2755_001974 [Methanohalophilus levihalophilus]|uniref:DUF7288 family protein n=1 Tax=Methanohalophilus levihalophilus TaxID=1431282 RepID=UPI001AE43723|nr:hypothetical protein [Methanohalophilus levihalophilus]MBP2031026.1 hypothetical protein [Methanohalophilus levihalophilus]